MKRHTHPRTPVLLVMASSDPALSNIQRQLGEIDVGVQLAASLQEFQQVIQQDDPIEVVISGVSLPDGNWCDVLTTAVRVGSSARVVVCSRDADERFWSEAIWRGVHDILVEPFTVDYLRRSVEMRFPSPQRDGEETNPGPQRTNERPSGTGRSRQVALAVVAA